VSYMQWGWALVAMGWLYVMVDAVARVARNIGRIADELGSYREEQARQFEIGRQLQERQHLRTPR
jgi:hypothetical protein